MKIQSEDKLAIVQKLITTFKMRPMLCNSDKSPRTKWSEATPLTAQQVVDYAATGSFVGYRIGEGTILLDLDNDTMTSVDKFNKLCEAYPEARQALMHMTPNGMHLLFRTDRPMAQTQRTMCSLGFHIDTRVPESENNKGGYAVMYPSESGKRRFTGTEIDTIQSISELPLYPYDALAPAKEQKVATDKKTKQATVQAKAQTQSAKCQILEHLISEPKSLSALQAGNGNGHRFIFQLISMLFQYPQSEQSAKYAELSSALLAAGVDPVHVCSLESMTDKTPSCGSMVEYCKLAGINYSDFCANCPVNKAAAKTPRSSSSNKTNSSTSILNAFIREFCQVNGFYSNRGFIVHLDKTSHTASTYRMSDDFVVDNVELPIREFMNADFSFTPDKLSSAMKSLVQLNKSVIIDDAVGFNNGYVTMPDFVFHPWTAGKEEYVYAKFSVDYSELTEFSTTPMFDKFISAQFDSLTDDIRFYYFSIIGNCISPYKAKIKGHRRAYSCSGVSGSGKSTFINIVQNLVPKSMRASVSLQDASKDDNMRPMLIGKILSTCPECESTHINTAMAKKIIDGEPVQVKLMYVDKYDMPINCTFLSATNEETRISADAKSFSKRYGMIKYTKSMRDSKECVNNLEELITKNESTALINNAILAYKTMILKGEWAKDLFDTTEQIETESSSVRSFIHQGLAIINRQTKIYPTKTSAALGFKDLYEHYKYYMKLYFPGKQTLAFPNFKSSFRDEILETFRFDMSNTRISIGSKNTGAICNLVPINYVGEDIEAGRLLGKPVMVNKRMLDADVISIKEFQRELDRQDEAGLIVDILKGKSKAENYVDLVSNSIYEGRKQDAEAELGEKSMPKESNIINMATAQPSSFKSSYGTNEPDPFDIVFGESTAAPLA